MPRPAAVRPTTLAGAARADDVFVVFDAATAPLTSFDAPLRDARAFDATAFNLVVIGTLAMTLLSRVPNHTIAHQEPIRAGTDESTDENTDETRL